MSGPTTEQIERFLTSIYQNHAEDGEITPLRTRAVKAMRHPVLTLAALKYLLSFPIVNVSIPSLDESKTRWLFNPRRPWQHRGFISSYIELPDPLEKYWQGTSKQNLRTRTHQARLAGFSTKPVASSEIIDVIAQVFRDKGWDVGEIESDLRKRDLRRVGEPLEGAICVAVVDSFDHVVGFCVGTQTGDVVRTLWSCTSQKGTVRWLCFSGFVQEVKARGGRFVIESPPWAYTGGNKIFAGHLGFRAARIRG